MRISVGESIGRNKCRWGSDCPNLNQNGRIKKGVKYISIYARAGNKSLDAAVCIDCCDRLFEELERAKLELTDEEIEEIEDEGEFDDE